MSGRRERALPLSSVVLNYFFFSSQTRAFLVTVLVSLPFSITSSFSFSFSFFLSHHKRLFLLDESALPFYYKTFHKFFFVPIYKSAE